MTQQSHKHASQTPADSGKSAGPTTIPAVSDDIEHGGKPVSHDDIRLCAYRKWEAAGRPDGDGVRFWLEAEQELVQSQQETTHRGGDRPGDRQHERQAAEKTVKDHNLNVDSHYRDNNRMFQSHGERGHRHGGSD